MIVRLKCPVCKKNSYTASVEVFRLCPYCGILFSGKYGIEKRNEVRTKKEIPLVFSYNGQNHNARTVNLSEKGLGIKIFGDTSISVGNTIYLSIKDYFLKAEVRWFTNKPDSSVSVAGMRIMDGSLNLQRLLP